jgi:hypothetical protein
MVEATVTRAIVMQDEVTKEPVLMGVCQYQDEHINFRVPFSKEEEEYDEVIKALRDKLAEDFQLPVYRVDVKEEMLLKRMKYYAKQIKEMVLH